MKFRRNKKEKVFMYSIEHYRANGGAVATDESIALGDAFVDLLYVMAGKNKPVPRELTPYQAGNFVHIIYQGKVERLFLTGMDSAEFLTNVQLYLAGIQPVWAELTPEGYWPSVEAYHRYVDITNPLIQLSIKEEK